MRRCLRTLIRDLGGALSETDVENATDLLSAGEHELALELVCAQLYQHSAHLSAAQFEALASLSRELRVSASQVECLAELVA